MAPVAHVMFDCKNMNYQFSVVALAIQTHTDKRLAESESFLSSNISCVEVFFRC